MKPNPRGEALNKSYWQDFYQKQRLINNLRPKDLNHRQRNMYLAAHFGWIAVRTLKEGKRVLLVVLSRNVNTYIEWLTTFGYTVTVDKSRSSKTATFLRVKLQKTTK